MKKFGFTLAEVLITLTIIGVVAMMTLPALMTNVQEQQAITGLKKGINTLSEAGQMNAAVNGFDFSGCTVVTRGANDQSFFSLLMNRLQVDRTASGITEAVNDGVATYTIAPVANNITRVLGGANAQADVIFLRDGSAIIYNNTTTVVGQNTPTLTVYYDTNGLKGPNLLSTCDRTQVAARALTQENRTANACETAGNRLIRDQFELTLVGGGVVPQQNSIAEWIIANR